MENYVNAIKTIEELSERIIKVQNEIKEIDAEAASLSAVEGDNTLSKQHERLNALEVAVDALATDSAKKVVEGEINAIKASIKRLERLDVLADDRGKTLVKLNKLNNDLTTVISSYKGYRMNFEKSFNKVAKDTTKLLSNETIPEDVDVTFKDAIEMSYDNKKEKAEEGLYIVEASSASEQPVVEEVTVEEEVLPDTSEVEETKAEEETPKEADEEDTEKPVVSPHPVMALAKVLRSFEELTDQKNADKYSSRYSGVLKEMVVSDSEKEALAKILDGNVEGLTPDQAKIIKLSMPKEIIGSQLKRADIVAERKNSTEVYAAGFLNQFRPSFTYKVIAELGRLILSNEPEQEKAMKIALFFKNNSDHMVKARFGGSKPEYRAFAVLNSAALEEI